MTANHDGELYTGQMIGMLEAVWGEGWLSPGGPEEVARVIDGVPLSGKSVLDIGCGVGGVDFYLIETGGAAHVTGIDVEETAVGDRYVYEGMRRVKSALGGEQSGHIIFYRGATGDGLRTAVRLAEVLAATGKPLTELRKVMTEFPQVLHNIEVADKGKLEASTTIWDAVSGAERDLAGDGRILVRASGTEPLVRVMVEAATEETAESVAGAIGEVVKTELG